MTIVYADRVKETTATTGTGTLTLGGASTQFQSFSAGIGNGNTCDYCILSGDGTNWEVGNGTYTSSGNTLSRTVIFASSNSGSAINLSGTSTVFCDAPAKRVKVLASGPQPQTISGSSTNLTINNASVTAYQVTSWAMPASKSVGLFSYSFTRNTTGSQASLVLVNGSGNGYQLIKQNDGNLVQYRNTTSSQAVISAESNSGNKINVAENWSVNWWIEFQAASTNLFTGLDPAAHCNRSSDNTYDFTSGTWTLYVTADANTTVGNMFYTDILDTPWLAPQIRTP